MFNVNHVKKYVESLAKKRSFAKGYRGKDRSAINKSFNEAWEAITKNGPCVKLVGDYRVTVFKRKGKKGNLCVVISEQQKEEPKPAKLKMIKTEKEQIKKAA